VTMAREKARAPQGGGSARPGKKAEQLPPDVHELFESLDPDGQKQAIGLLKREAQSSDQRELAALIQIWLPELEGHRDIGQVKEDKDKGLYPYQQHKGDLFVDGVKPDDVMQGQIGDCYLAAAMAAVAASSPKAIEDAFTPVGKDVWSVRLYRKDYSGGFKAEKVVVDSDLPTRGTLNPARPWRSVGGPAYGMGTTVNEKGRELWPSMLEKAFAKWKGSYEDIGQGGMPGAVMEAILGKEADSTYASWTREDEVWKAITSVPKGRPMSAYTRSDDKPYEQKKDKVVGCHAYTVLGGEEKAGQKIVKVRNPWGSSGEVFCNGRMIYGAEFEISLAEFLRLFEGWDRV
ncbi:MAG: hypothetical protein FJ125_00930, partial [Deltaproteobacteria bacterium]|nr:hypothetical protein [Deltaproteobacteria bacterium]